MPTRDSYEPGTPCWVDVMSPDVDASAAFYTALFGWEARDEHDDQGNRVYVTLLKDGKRTAGLGGMPPSMPDDMPAAWNTYVATDDPAAIAAKVEAAGGGVMMPPMDVMGEGEMAVFHDPTGAVFSVWKAGNHHGSEVINEPDAYSWNELLTKDPEGAKSFYGDVFGWEFEDQSPDGTTPYWVILGGDSGGLGGVMERPADMPDMVPDHWGVYITVADAAATLERAAELGAQVLFGPEVMPGVGTLGTFMDPLGGSLNVMQPEVPGAGI